MYLQTKPDLHVIIPGLERLEKTGERSYDLGFHVEHAPLQGSYEGKYTLVEHLPSTFYRFQFEGKGERGAFSGSGQFHLREHRQVTIISYKGVLTLSAASAHFHPTLVKGAIKLMIQQYCTALSAQIHAYQAEHLQSGVAEHPGSPQVGGTITVLPPVTSQATAITTGLLARGVQWFKPAQDGSEDEVLRTQRIRRMSLLIGVLFGLWLGSRILRRRQNASFSGEKV